MSKLGKIEIKGLKEFQTQIQNAQKRVEDLKLEVANTIAQEFLKEVIERTPKSNNNKLKNNWKYKITKDETGYNIEVYNDLQYAPYVEHGHKTKYNGFIQGHHMLHLTKEDIEERMNNITTPILEKYLQEVFK